MALVKITLKRIRRKQLGNKNGIIKVWGVKISEEGIKKWLGVKISSG